ncbi:MAG: hypothetical protein ABSE41_14075 [Bacteroidota bacterium]
MTNRYKHLITAALVLLVLSVGWENRDTSPVRFGKIYLFDQTLYVSELTRGVRQLGISSPSSPANLGLIKMAGNHDTALRGTADDRRILYADSYADLIVFDVTDPATPKALDTLRNIFGQSYAIGWGDDILLGRPPNMAIDDIGGVEGCWGCREKAISPTSVMTSSSQVKTTADASSPSEAGSSSGRGGSMARFAVVDDYLYCVDYNQLYVFEIENPAKPRFVNRVQIGWGIETIFPYTNYLFIGGENGMFIYSRSDPRNPKYVSMFQHARSCDPVVVEGSYAYVTLRGGTRCGMVVSALHVVAIADLFNPKIIASYPLPQPMGLDVRSKIAYVCDDSAGVVVLDATDPVRIRELARITGKPGYDTILQNDMLIVVSEGAVSFYNVSHPDAPFLLGRFQLPA